MNRLVRQSSIFKFLKPSENCSLFSNTATQLQRSSQNRQISSQCLAVPTQSPTSQHIARKSPRVIPSNISVQNRNYSTQFRRDKEKIRNIAIIAHVDVGKTVLYCNSKLHEDSLYFFAEWLDFG